MALLYWLVWVFRTLFLGEDGSCCSDCGNYQEDEGEYGVVDEENDSHDARHNTGLIEDIDEEDEKDGVYEANHGDGNIENVSSSVNPWPINGHCNKHD